MTTRGTFRLGKLKADSLPSPDDVAEGIDDEFEVRSTEEDPETGGTIEFAEKGRDPHVEADYDGYNYCFFTYVTDTSESFRVRDENGEEKPESQSVLQLSWAIYFENGQFAYQSRNDIANAWIPRYIKKAAGMDPTNDDYTLDKIGQDELRSAYDSADRVTKIAFGNPGEDEETDISSAGEKLQELAEVADGLSFSTGQGGDEDIRDPSLIQDAVDALKIKRLNRKKDDQNVVVLKESGRIEISWNESDWDENSATRNRSQEVRSKLRPYLEAIEDAR